MAGPELLIAIVWLGVPALFVWSMVRHPPNRSIATFAKQYWVPLTPHNVTQLRRYIQWTRRWRLAGVAVAFVLVGGWNIATASSGGAGVGWIPFVIGYGVGSMIGELTRPAERPASTAIATLQQRGVRDYVSTFIISVTGIVFVASLVPAVYLLASNPQRPWVDRVEPLGQRPQDWFVALLAGASVAVAVACWFASRLLAQAPAPADSPDRQAVRHAIRTSAIISIFGVAIMMLGMIGAKLGGSAVTMNNVVDRTEVMSWILGICSFGCGLVAMSGALLTFTSVPRLGPFAGKLPAVPLPEPEPPRLA